MIPALLGLGWGTILALPLIARAQRCEPNVRAGDLGTVKSHPCDPVPSSQLRRFASRLVPLVPKPPVALVHVVAGLQDRVRARRLDAVIAHEIPVTVDLLSVAVASGCTPFLAVEVAARWSPPVLAAALTDARRTSTLGRSFSDALERVVAEVPAFGPVADALLVSERLGAPVGEALQRLADELRSDLRRRAETRARTIPVRLLFPLVFLVLPAFGLLTVVPAVASGLAGA